MVNHPSRGRGPLTLTAIPRPQTHFLAMTTAEAEAFQHLVEAFADHLTPGRHAHDCQRLLARMTAWHDVGGEPNIMRVLDVSIGHLTDDERERLSLGNLPGQIACCDYGGLVVVHDLGATRHETGISPTRWAIERYAAMRGCRYVLYDSDAPDLPGLPALEAVTITLGD